MTPNATAKANEGERGERERERERERDKEAERERQAAREEDRERERQGEGEIEIHRDSIYTRRIHSITITSLGVLFVADFASEESTRVLFTREGLRKLHQCD